MTSSADWIEIGKIVGPQGLQGQVKVLPNSDFPERFLEPGTRWLQRRGQREPEPIELTYGRDIPGKNLFVIEIDGIEDRDEAEALRDAVLYVPGDDRPELEEGEFHVMDLVGLIAINHETGDRLGIVTDVMSSGNDLLSIELDTPIVPQDTSSSKRRLRRKQKPVKPQTHALIPFVEAIVPVVDVAGGCVRIVPVPGLIDERSVTIREDTPDPTAEIDPSSTPETPNSPSA
ncbi:MAG: ribosome maturation factor RimM [Oscillatoriales cyanobacterium]|nr:MAG: ribosome maturation factor RimM [Oscillatoriales cyanobacterium]